MTKILGGTLDSEVVRHFRRCSKIIFLGNESKYIRHSSNNVFVVIPDYLLKSGSNWDGFLQLPCISLEVSTTNIASSSISLKTQTVGSDNDTINSILSVQQRLMTRANWFTVIGLVRVLRTILKHVRDEDGDDDDDLAVKYIDSIGALLKLLYSLVGKSSFVEAEDSTVNEHPIFDTIIALVPELLYCYFHKEDGYDEVHRSQYLRHKMLDLPRTLKRWKRRTSPTNTLVIRSDAIDGNTSSPVPPRLLVDTSQHHQDSAQRARRENEAHKRKVVPLFQEQTSNQLTSAARNTDINFNQVAPYTGISFPTTPIRKTPQDGNASSTMPPRVLEDIAQRHQDTGPKVSMLVQEGLSCQVLAQRPRRKFEENIFVAFERLPVQDKGLSKQQITQHARREKDGNIDFNRVASCTAISFPTAPIPKNLLEIAPIPQDIPIRKSIRQMSQRARRERERQLKGDAIIRGISQRAKVARNFDVDLNQASICTGISVPIVFTTAIPTVPSPVPVANDNVFSTEEDLLSNVIPIPPFSHTHETDNFPSLRSFEIGDTSRTRVNMFNVDFNDQCASSEDENCQRNDIKEVGCKWGYIFLDKWMSNVYIALHFIG
ncbi:hypothetical protein GIB67_029632 [Kingdonia uniflora]|uniref:Uncharacterized protein n=1 Tax=Kingdonia uniflora TaxID=39325 RepID=A0A7J7LLH6_9MAGN|nr:hypothetical protein GIB67_029632 [Kingdonia uniflora]